MDFLTAFTQDLSPRASGTDQEKRAAEFLADRFKELGYETSLQPFTVEVIPPDIPVLSLAASDVQGFPMTLSGIGSATGALVHIGKAQPADMPAARLDGKLALIERGVITFEEKVTRAADAGALAAVVYNNQPGLFRGTLSTQARIPAIAISQESGQEILGLLGSGAVEATVRVVIETRSSQNVIAEKPGAGDADVVVVLGGHYDTVPNVPGANDNGSGIATLITIAREISAKSYPFTVRFIAFGSEELGLFGSRHYVDSLSDEEQADTIAMLNFDALSTGPHVGLLGDLDLLPDILAFAKDKGIVAERRLVLGGGSSDHAPFQAAGIPHVFFLADDFSRIHTPEDKLEFVRPELMGGSAALAIELLDMLAE